MIERLELINTIKKALEISPIVSIRGHHQIGKSTIVQQFVPFDSANYFNLKNPEHLNRLRNSLEVLKDLKGFVVIDDVNLLNEFINKLGPIIKDLCDRSPLPARFLIVQQNQNSINNLLEHYLSPKLVTIDMNGLSLAEVGEKNRFVHWSRGGYPASFIASSDMDSLLYREQIILNSLYDNSNSIFIDRNINNILRFLKLVASFQGKIWTDPEPRYSTGLSSESTRKFFVAYTRRGFLRVIEPWEKHSNQGRLISPKIFFRDSGIFNKIVGFYYHCIMRDSDNYPQSWIGYALEETMKALMPDEIYYHGVLNPSELEVVMIKNGNRYVIRFRYAHHHELTKSMQNTIKKFGLKKYWLIYPIEAIWSTEKKYLQSKNIILVPLSKLAEKPFDFFSV